MLSDEHPSLSSAIRLRYALKAPNDTVGEKGLVHSMLIFGVMPFLGNSNANVNDQGVSFEALKQEREEAATIIDDRRISRPLKSNVPPSATYKLKTGQAVNVYSEKTRQVEERTDYSSSWA